MSLNLSAITICQQLEINDYINLRLIEAQKKTKKTQENKNR